MLSQIIGTFRGLFSPNIKKLDENPILLPYTTFFPICYRQYNNGNISQEIFLTPQSSLQATVPCSSLPNADQTVLITKARNLKNTKSFISPTSVLHASAPREPKQRPRTHARINLDIEHQADQPVLQFKPNAPYLHISRFPLLS